MSNRWVIYITLLLWRLLKKEEVKKTKGGKETWEILPCEHDMTFALRNFEQV